MKKPVIIKKGDNPNCVHYEIIVGYIGTCKFCGQVRDYKPCYIWDDQDTIVKEKARKGQAKLRQKQKAGVA